MLKDTPLDASGLKELMYKNAQAAGASLSFFHAHFLSLSLSRSLSLTLSLSLTHTHIHIEYGHQLDLQNQPKLTFLERLNAGGLCLGFIGLNLICVHCCAVCMGYKVASL